MTDRDKKEVGSKFWNEGKWENFVAPLIKEPKGVFIDVGCNAGVFLNAAEKMGFEKVIGIDSDEVSVERGKNWADRHEKGYEFLLTRMEDYLKEVPVADYTVLANTHYYFTINDWLDYLDRLQYKTRYCIIVTAKKTHANYCWARTDIESIRGYFRVWEETGFVDELPLEGQHARRMWGLCFKSPFIERVEIDSIRSRNEEQSGFYAELDNMPYKETEYYWFLKGYRKKWSEEKLDQWFEGRERIYKDIKENGLKKAIIVDSDGIILDGNHRYEMLKHLGYKEVFVRKT